MFGLAQRYIKSGKNGFVSAIITGKRRVGKTMYSMQTVYQICRYNGMKEGDAWDVALNSIIFTMDDLIKAIRNRSHKNRRDFLIWDDAGVYGAGMLYLYQVNNAMVLKAIMDVIGTRVKMLLLTCPDSQGLMKFLRRYSDFLIRVGIGRDIRQYDRNAYVSSPYWAKGCSIRWRKAWTDEFNVKIPNWIYERYIEKRDSYANIIIKELMKRGKDGEAVADETYGEDHELVRQGKLQSDVVPTDLQGYRLPDGAKTSPIRSGSGLSHKNSAKK